MALLSGHANANTTEDILPDSEKQAVVEASSSAGEEVSAEDFLNAHNDKVKKRLEEVNKLRQANMKEFQARYTQEQQVILQEEMRVLSERGEWMQTFTLMKNHAAKIKQALNQENARFMAMHGQAWDPKKDGDDSTGLGSIEKLMDMDGGDMSSGGLPMVRPGDASKSKITNLSYHIFYHM